MACEVFLKSRANWTSVVDMLHTPWQEIRRSFDPGTDLDKYFRDLISHHVPTRRILVRSRISPGSLLNVVEVLMRSRRLIDSGQGSVRVTHLRISAQHRLRQHWSLHRLRGTI